MAVVYGELTMSLNGYIANSDDTIEPLFDWYEQGAVRTPARGRGGPDGFSTSPQSAELMRTAMDELGALVVGRRLFDLTGGWNGEHPLGAPVVLLSHSIPDGWPRAGSPYAFVTEGGVAAAIARARELADGKSIALGGPNVIQQALNEGLLDELRVHLAPVLLGAGIPFFAQLARTPLLLDDPRVVEGERVTHLVYRVRRLATEEAG
jgi:dihydrofolate reductase